MTTKDSSPDLRAAQREFTRERILQAVAELLAEEGDRGLSLANVAKRARVSIATMYRHFPTEDALETAFAEWARRQYGFRSYDQFAPAELGGAARRLYATFEAHEALTRGLLRSAIGRALSARARRDRIAGLRRALEPVLARLPPAEATRVLAAVQLFLSAAACVHMRENLELAPGEAGDVAAWAIETLLGAATARRR